MGFVSKILRLLEVAENETISGGKNYSNDLLSAYLDALLTNPRWVIVTAIHIH